MTITQGVFVKKKHFPVRQIPDGLLLDIYPKTLAIFYPIFLR